MARTRKTETDDSLCVTPRQMEILRMIRDGRRANGYSPTLQEMADELGISKITVFEHVEALLEKGMLTRRSNKARSLELTNSARLPDERPTLLPLVGRIAAGRPIEAIETSDAVDLEQLYNSRHPVGVLTVTGDSMIDEHICEGDLVVFEKRSNARNGETVVALINGEEATLKKFYREKGRIRLQPANSRYRPIYPTEVDIQGVVVGVIRKL
ncbi:MAG: transcriptional repressor LexA [Phycisphaerae bacterium]|nr:transcriptional repressor LexA [Phycisphaerae bacterium]